MRRLEVSLCALTLVAIAGLFILTGCAPPKTEKPEADSVQALADEYLEALLERFPEIATYYGIPDRSHDRLTDNSLAALRAWEKREDAWLARLRQLESEFEPGSPDWAIYGIPFDGGVTWQPGARFGPRAVRDASQ